MFMYIRLLESDNRFKLGLILFSIHHRMLVNGIFCIGFGRIKMSNEIEVEE